MIDARRSLSYIVVGSRKPPDPRQFAWVNSILDNLKTTINGGHKAFKVGKYAGQYLGVFCYRANTRFDLRDLLHTLICHAASGTPKREQKVREVTLAEVLD